MPYGPKSRIFNKTNERFGKNLHLLWHNTTWMDNESTKLYLEKTFGGIVGFFKPKQLLVWDAFKAHTSEDIKKDGVTKDNLANSFKACGIGAFGGADDHLIPCLKKGQGIPNGLYELTKAREAAEAQELAEILAGLEIGRGRHWPRERCRSRGRRITATDEEDSGPEVENHNLSDDSDI